MKYQLLFLFALILSLNVNAQSKILGNISDSIGVLSDANIIIKGTEKGTISDLKGDFEIEAKPNDTLSISYLGYGTKEIVVKKQKSITITLDVDNTLDEVEVVAFSSRTVSCSRGCKTSTRCGVCCYAYGLKIMQLEDQDIKQVMLYPNPSSTGFFNLKMFKDYKTVKIQVTTISGQIVLCNSFQNVNKTVSLDLSKLTSGIYIINTIADDKMLPAKKAIRG